MGIGHISFGLIHRNNPLGGSMHGNDPGINPKKRSR